MSISPGQTISRSPSPLDKPLHQLTNDDISQVTREDCRRYLKQKGMRRPSWNKSQVIQQVISLKTLLERTPSDSDAIQPRKMLYIPRPQTQHRENDADTRISVSAEESAPYRILHPQKPDLSGDFSGRLASNDNNDSVSPGNSGAANVTAGQMTIFYCGKVNVYDDVSNDKARAIMQLATSRLPWPLEPLSGAGVTPCSFPCQILAAGVKMGPSSPLEIFPSRQTLKVTENHLLPREESNSHEDSLEGKTSRKASVQRYLEKRKDRFKNKRKIAVVPSTGLDIYLNHRMGDQFLNKPNQSDVCSPELRTAHVPAGCDSVENLAMTANIPADLSEKDVHER